MKYEVIIFYFGGGHATVQSRGRTSWALKTAEKRKSKIVREMVLTGVCKNCIVAKAEEYITRARANV